MKTFALVQGDLSPSKHCFGCGRDLLLTSFYKSAGKKDGVQSRCKDCKLAQNKAWKDGNRDRSRQTHRAWRNGRREEITDWYYELKSGPCSDCGQTFHPCAMDWDHLPGQTKTADVSRLVIEHRSRDEILAEIAKCELVCSNCHRVRTFLRRGGQLL